MKFEYIIEDWDLFSILNLCNRSASRRLKIHIPYLEKALFEIYLSDKHSEVRCLISPNVYKKETDKVKNAGIKNEIPNYNDLKAAFTQSGIVEYPNIKTLRDEAAIIQNRDLLKGDRPVWIGLDTNLYMDRFYTTQLNWLKLMPQHKIGLSISPYVRRELQFHKKYTKEQIRKLANLLVDVRLKKYIHEFYNQNCLNDRRRRIGFEEIERAKRKQWIMLLPELAGDLLQKDQDANIILSYKLAAQHRNVDILLLSRDRDFIARAEGLPGVYTFLVDTPEINLKQNHVENWYNIVQLIYILAIQFGAIRLHAEKLKVDLLGIWAGKTTEEWKDDAIKLFFSDDFELAFPLNRVIKTLREMDWVYE